jgi:glucose-1-phosphatase
MALSWYVQELQHRGILHGYETGGLTTSEFLAQMSSVAGSPLLTPQQIEKIWNSIFIGMPAHRFDLLLQLRKKYQVFLLSNINDLHLRYIEDYLAKTYGIHDFEQRYFDGVFYSHLVRMRKPDEGIYQYLLTDAQIEPEQAAFFDDLPENIQAAQSLGIQGHLHNPTREILEHVTTLGYLQGL